MSNLFSQSRIPFRLRYASPSLHAGLNTNIIYYNIISKNSFIYFLYLMSYGTNIGVTLSKYRPCGTLLGREDFHLRRLRFATPTVNKVSPLRGFSGMIADNH